MAFRNSAEGQFSRIPNDVHFCGLPDPNGHPNRLLELARESRGQKRPL